MLISYNWLSLFASDASAALQVRALKDYCNNYDLTSLNIKAGDVITVTHIGLYFENVVYKGLSVSSPVYLVWWGIV